MLFEIGLGTFIGTFMLSLTVAPPGIPSIIYTQNQTKHKAKLDGVQSDSPANSTLVGRAVKFFLGIIYSGTIQQSAQNKRR